MTRTTRRTRIHARAWFPRTLMLHLAPALAIATLMMAPAAARAEEGPQWYSNGQKIGSSPYPVALRGSVSLAWVGGEDFAFCESTSLEGSVWNEGGRGVGKIEGFDAGCSGSIETKNEEERTRSLFEAGEAKCYLPGSSLLEERCLSTLLTPERIHAAGQRALVCKSGAALLSKCPNAEEREERLAQTQVSRETSLPWPMELKRVEGAPRDVIGIGAEGRSCNGGTETVPAGCVKLNVVWPQIASAGGEWQFNGALQTVVVNGTSNGLHPSRLEFGAAAGSELESTSLKGHMSGELKLLGAFGQQLIQAK